MSPLHPERDLLYAVIAVEDATGEVLAECVGRDLERLRHSRDGRRVLVKWDPTVTPRPAALGPIPVLTFAEAAELMTTPEWADEETPE